jgi:hypothetical protein
MSRRGVSISSLGSTPFSLSPSLYTPLLICKKFFVQWKVGGDTPLNCSEKNVRAYADVPMLVAPKLGGCQDFPGSCKLAS